MFPWRTVGLHAPSSFSVATCAQRVEECQRQAVTKQAQMISDMTWFSSVPLRSSSCPSPDRCTMLGWSNCTNHPRHRVSTWPRPRIWWAESPWSPAFWMAMRLQLSLTSTARTRVHVSLPDVRTQLRRMEGEAATSMRLTLGCGSLGVASLALAAWQSRRLRRGKNLPANRRTSVGRRLVRDASVMVPEWKWSVSVIWVSMYGYIPGTYGYVPV